MRYGLLVSLVVVSTIHLQPKARANDADPIKKTFGEYAAAFNAKDAGKVASFWAENSQYLDRQTGERTEGRAAIAADITSAFADQPNQRLLGRIDNIRFIKPDVASTSGVVTVSNPGEEPVAVGFSAIMVLDNGRWLFDSVEESAMPIPNTSYDALQRLGWLVGEWEDQSSSAFVNNAFRWSANRAFLIRSFASQTTEGEVSEGTQVIGWDPRSMEIRSWTFNSDGSFGDATWSSSGEDWLIKSSQTLSDGDAASGTYILSKISEDEVTLKLIGHEVEGEPQPTGQAATLVRRSNESGTSDDAPPVNAQNLESNK